MSVSPSTTRIVQQIGKPEPLGRTNKRRVVAIECETVGATAELVYQRGDFEEAERHDAAHDAWLEAALRVPGLPPLAGELIRRAQAADVREDAALYERALRRRANAHDHARNATRGCEQLLTGREGMS